MKKARILRINDDGRRNIEYITGRVLGIISVATNQEINRGYAIECVINEITGLYDRVMVVEATDDEWEITKRYVFSNDLYKELITIVKE